MGNPRTASKKNEGADSELHAAARSGDLRAVESICSSDPLAFNSRDKHSRTPSASITFDWDGKMTVRLLKKYLVNKFGLEDESEVDRIISVNQVV